MQDQLGGSGASTTEQEDWARAVRYWAEAELRGHLAGSFLCPDDADYDDARRIWNGLIDKHPALIVRCRRPEDVALALRFARDHLLPVSVKGGGHNVAGKSLVDRGVVIDLGPMRDVIVAAATPTENRPAVRIEGGARLSDVDSATYPYGLAVPLGLVGATGVAGFTLHGGYGWLARKLGLALDNLLGVEMVTADGRQLYASEQENPDLFWAVRGGGGNFGVVTAFEMRAHPVPDPVWMNAVFYSLDHAPERIELLREIAAMMPDDVTILATLWSLAHAPPVPVSARGAPVLAVLACHAGPASEGEHITEPLRHLGPVVLDLSGPLPFIDVQRFFDADYPDGRLYYWKSIYVPELSGSLISTLCEAAPTRPSALSSIDVWFLGGAVGRVPVTATAFPHRDAPYLIALESSWNEPAATRANIEWTRDVYCSLEPFSNRAAYLNFAGLGENAGDLVRSAYGPNYDRLREIKRRYDPDNVFQANFNIPP